MTGFALIPGPDPSSRLDRKLITRVFCGNDEGHRVPTDLPLVEKSSFQPDFLSAVIGGEDQLLRVMRTPHPLPVKVRVTRVCGPRYGNRIGLRR